MPLSAVRDWLLGRGMIVLAAALAAVLSLTGPGVEAKTIVVTDPVPPSSLNPFNQMDAVSHRACIQIYEHLTLLTSTGESVPGLAESWTRIGRNIYHFKLRPGVKFHDGRPVTADDVVYSLEAAKKGRLGRLLKVDRATRISDNVVEVISSSPALTAELAFAGFIVPKGSADSLAENPIGSGPFKFVARRGDVVELAAFKDYWNKDGLKGADRLIFKPSKDDGVRRRWLEEGKTDIITDVNPHLKLALLKSQGALIRLYSQDSARIFFVVINSHPYPGKEDLRAKLASPEVRRALNMAVDCNRLIDVIMLGNGATVGSPLVGVIPGSSRSPAYDYDPERAKEILKNAGADKAELTLAYSPERWFGGEYLAMGVAKYLSQIGLKVDLVSLPWPKFLPTLVKEGRKFDLYLWSWGNPILDPSFTVDTLLNQDPWRPWEDQTTTQLIARSAAATDRAERLRIFEELDNYLHRAAPWIFLFQKIDSYATSRRIKLQTAPTELFRVYYDVTWAEEG